MEQHRIGETLKQARIKAGLKVQDVSELMKSSGYEKASVKTVYSWESGNSQPAPDYFLKLCDLYGITDILSAFGYRKEEPTVDTDDQLSIHEDIFMSLPENLRQDALRYMRYLVEQEDKQK
ncbi:helix-turn-helix transcriptional regulator [Clostridiaceae bacterium NSJ-31]|uniref:Helix-turn-helix transcriptional regulator n=1 Tax=Ligaoa zhengdingensis TaxID=2763658 RepID=A0A926DYU0_9FIRM|nr:helix-turn-helix transcriptional regulator [Ligaoa zhengdingensis]MBC8546082.1 helix-turn-helix transcriptional regulator [Ligaoa zhengdingensis]